MYKQVHIARTRNKQIEKVFNYYDEFIVIKFKDKTYSVIKSTTGYEGEDKLWTDSIFDIESNTHANDMLKIALEKLKIISKEQIEVANKKQEVESKKERYKEYLILKEEFGEKG